MSRRFYQTSYESSTSTTSTSYQTKLTLTFTPEANSSYILLFSSLIGCSSNYGWIRIYDGTTTWFEASQYEGLDSDYSPFGGAVLLTFGSSPSEQNFYMQIKSGTSGGYYTSIKMSRMIAIKLESGDISTQDLTRDTTTGSTYLDKALITPTAESTDYLAIGSCILDGSNTAIDSRCRLRVGSNYYGTSNIATKTSNNRYSYLWFEKVTLSAGTVSFSVQYSSESGTNTCGISYASAFLLKLSAGFEDSVYAYQNSEQTTTSEATALTASFSGKSGNYWLILACCLWKYGYAGTSYYGKCGLYETTATDIGYSYKITNDTTNYFCYKAIYYETSLSSSYTIKHGSSNSGYTNYTDDLRIVGLNLGEPIILLSGSISGTGSPSGSIIELVDISGVIAGSSSLSGSIKKTVNITGAIATTSTLSGRLDRQPKISGTIAGTSALSGIITGLGALMGAIAGTSLLTGTEDSQQPLVSSISSLSVCIGVLRVDVGVSGIITGTSTASGLLARELTVLAIIEGQSSLSTALIVDIKLAGSISGTGSLTGTLTRYVDLLGSVTSTTTADVTLLFEFVGVTGIIESTSSLSATLTVDRSLIGDVDGTSALSGITDLQPGLAGTIAGSGSLTGLLMNFVYTSSLIAGTSTVTGTIGKDLSLSGTVAAISTLDGTIQIIEWLIGSVRATSTLAAQWGEDLWYKVVIFSRSYLAGRITREFEYVYGWIWSRGKLAGSLQFDYSLSGSCDAKFNGIGYLAVYRRFVVEIPAVITATGFLAVVFPTSSSITSISNVSAKLRVQRNLTSSIETTSTVTGTLSDSNVQLTCVIAGHGTLVPGFWGLAVTRALIGTIDAAFFLVGLLGSFKSCRGTIPEISSLSGELYGATKLIGSIASTSTLTGEYLDNQPYLSGTVISESSVEVIIIVDWFHIIGTIPATSNLSATFTWILSAPWKVFLFENSSIVEIVPTEAIEVSLLSNPIGVVEITTTLSVVDVDTRSSVVDLTNNLSSVTIRTNTSIVGIDYVD